MAPDKIERTIEFILEHQAQITINLEQMQGQTRDVQAAILILTDLAQTQSLRLDRHGESLKQHDQDHKETLARLDEILRRLTERD